MAASALRLARRRAAHLRHRCLARARTLTIRRPPAVVLWGARPCDYQAGSRRDRARAARLARQARALYAFRASVAPALAALRRMGRALDEVMAQQGRALERATRPMNEVLERQRRALELTTRPMTEALESQRRLAARLELAQKRRTSTFQRNVED